MELMAFGFATMVLLERLGWALIFLVLLHLLVFDLLKFLLELLLLLLPLEVPVQAFLLLAKLLLFFHATQHLCLHYILVILLGRLLGWGEAHLAWLFLLLFGWLLIKHSVQAVVAASITRP